MGQLVEQLLSTPDIFVNSGNTMNKSFQWTDTVFPIDQVNIVTMNILELDMQCR